MKTRYLCLILLALAAPLYAEDLHVAPGGSDDNRGTAAAPVATLERARNLARDLRRAKPNEPITILCHPGVYRIEKTVQFDGQDSGTKSAPLTIRGLVDSRDPKARAHMVGGVIVPNWKKTTFNGRDDVYVADLAPLKITKKFRQLYLDGTRQIWARYPNWNPNLPYSGVWIYVDGKRPPMYVDIEGERCDTVVLREKNMRDWARPTDGEVCIFPRYNWWNRIERIKAFDPATRTITLTKNMQYAARPEDRFAVFGMKEELDAPGEWYQDVEGQKLYFIPPAGTDLAKQTVTIPTVDYTLFFNACKFVEIDNLEFSCAEQGAIKLNSCEDCTVTKSLVHDLGYYEGAGIALGGGFRCSVVGCDIWHIGGHGVSVYAGKATEMEKCEHVVDNCYIHHVGEFNKHGLGIMVGGTGVTMTHNLIHDTPRCGIFHGGVLHRIEYNRIRHCNMEMEDTGCTYGGGWTGGWTLIRYNHVSDSIGYNNHGKFHVFAWGIYLDESGCGFDVFGNIVEGCQVGAMHLHDARENHIRNNVFVNNAGMSGTARQFSMQGWDDSPNGVFLKDRQPKMLKEYNKLIENPQWLKMRGMHVSPKDPFLPDGSIMRGNRVERNIFYYPDQPKSRYAGVHRVNFEYNILDYNVIWSGGAPILTGAVRHGKPIADLTDRIPNGLMKPAAEQAVKAKPEQTAAEGWTWYHKTFPDMKSEIVSAPDTNGGRSDFFRLFARYNPELRYIKNACIRSTPFSLTPGKDYRFSFDLTLDKNDGGMLARLVSESNGLWKAVGEGSFKRVERNKPTRCEVSFRYPGKGEPEFDDRLGPVTIQFQFMSKTGTADIGNFKLEEVVPMSEWQSWQAEGADVHSVVADPLFVDPAKGDYRVKDDSPALKLGFRQIPIDKIGPYADARRASWPIKEADGVREHPEWLTEVPIE